MFDMAHTSRQSGWNMECVAVTCINYDQLVSQANIYNFDFSLYLNVDQPFNSKPPGGVQARIREQNNAE